LFIDLITNNFFDIPVKIDGIVVGSWGHGIPSGIKWTALLDSIIGDVRFSTITDILGKGNFRSVVVVDKKFTGDDLSVVLQRLVDAVRLLAAYNTFSIELHPLKNMVSVVLTEYLRKIYFAGIQLAYPNRMISKFLFRSPESRGSPNIRSLLTERSYSLFRMFNRAKNTEKGIKLILDMIQYVMVIDNKKATKVLSSYNVLGGFGYLLDNSYNWKKRDVASIITWPEDRQKKKGMPLANLYSESVNYYNELFDVSNASSSLRTALFDALSDDPVPFDSSRRIVIEDIEYRIKLNVNTKIIISTNRPNSRWEKWLQREDFYPPNLTDILSSMRSKDDLMALRAISNDRIILLLEELRAKSSVVFFWDWVESKLENISFVSSGTNEVQRSNICNIVQSTILSRVLSAHKSIDHHSYNKALLV
jgi:hypothetical protein